MNIVEGMSPLDMDVVAGETVVPGEARQAGTRTFASYPARDFGLSWLAHMKYGLGRPRTRLRLAARNLGCDRRRAGPRRRRPLHRAPPVQLELRASARLPADRLLPRRQGLRPYPSGGARPAHRHNEHAGRDRRALGHGDPGHAGHQDFGGDRHRHLRLPRSADDPLGVISARSVVERRQQIGVLRAIGFQRGMVQLAFLLEASFVALTSIVVGSALGLTVARNVIADSADQPSYQGALHFSAPWGHLAIVFAAALLTTLAPAARAARVRPAEALRYE